MVSLSADQGFVAYASSVPSLPDPRGGKRALNAVKGFDNSGRRPAPERAPAGLTARLSPVSRGGCPGAAAAPLWRRHRIVCCPPFGGQVIHRLRRRCAHVIHSDCARSVDNSRKLSLSCTLSGSSAWTKESSSRTHSPVRCNRGPQQLLSSRDLAANVIGASPDRSLRDSSRGRQGYAVSRRERRADERASSPEVGGAATRASRRATTLIPQLGHSPTCMNSN